jgi:hypothetical protein
MSIIDSKLYFGAGLDPDGSAYVGDVVDLGPAGKDGWGATLTEILGAGQTIYFNIVITEAIDEAGSIELCTDNALSSGDCDSGLYIATIPYSSSGLALGTRISVTVPARALAGRYLQVHCTETGTITTGGFTAWLSAAPVDSDAGNK